VKIKIKPGDVKLRPTEKTLYITDKSDQGERLGYLWIGTDERCFGTIDYEDKKKMVKAIVRSGTHGKM
jgi:hypothetical protein